jgi:hypothetical protein
MNSDGKYPEGEPGIPADVRRDILAADRRQMLLEVLAESSEPVPVWDLAASVRARERAVDVDAVDETETRAVRAELFESHLPKLAATGVIEYDSMLGAVRLTDSGIVTTLE